MIEFWTNPMSRGQIAHWMLEELGQPYQTNWLDWGPTGNKSAQFLAVNPMGKFPPSVTTARWLQRPPLSAFTSPMHSRRQA